MTEQPVSAACDPESGEAQYRLGLLLAQQGRFAEAGAALERSIAEEPRRAGAHFALTQIKRLGPDDRPLIARMLALAADPGLADGERALLHFALGKAHDDLAEYETAIRHFDDANRLEAERLRREGHVADREVWMAGVAALMARATRHFFARHAGIGSDSELPVLIVGMPRSGTTLVEQILSRHPAVVGAGELAFWRRRAAALGPTEADRLGAATARRLAEDYIALLRGIAPNASRVIDKTPGNFQHLGLVHLVFPRAHIVHCRRHPVDTCLSNYFTPFDRQASPLQPRERGDLVAFYE